MPIINPLPYNIANGDPVDATPVTANLTQIVNDVNSGAAAVGGLASQQFFVAPTSNPAGAVPLLQAQQEFAALSGNSGQVFNVATATTNNEAVPLGQAQSQFAAIEGSPGFQFAVANATATQSAVPLTQTIGGGATQYSNVTASRAIGTVYTNSSGRPLAVVLTLVIPAGVNVTLSDSTSAYYYGGASNNGSSSHTFTFLCLVPTGATYHVLGASGAILSSWFEY
jgi:hypothetical protein